MKRIAAALVAASLAGGCTSSESADGWFLLILALLQGGLTDLDTSGSTEPDPRAYDPTGRLTAAKERAAAEEAARNRAGQPLPEDRRADGAEPSAGSSLPRGGRTPPPPPEQVALGNATALDAPSATFRPFPRFAPGGAEGDGGGEGAGAAAAAGPGDGVSDGEPGGGTDSPGLGGDDG